MPPRRRAPARRGRPAKPRFALKSHPRRRMLYNPQPVFTETFKATTLTANAGFNLSSVISQVPQVSQYSNLYQKYRIIKAVWLMFPTWSGGEQQNVAVFNAASGPSVPPGLYSVGTSRVVFAINDTPAQTLPTSENEVLQDTGCKVKFLDKKLTITNHPTADLKDANGVQMTLKKKFINFATTGNPDVTHYGVNGWITQPVSGTGTAQQYAVYCKLTFQLADPR